MGDGVGERESDWNGERALCVTECGSGDQSRCWGCQGAKAARLWEVWRPRTGGGGYQSGRQSRK